MEVMATVTTHLQPFNPATPLICPIPQARMPPKAPAIEAAEKNRATRYCLSARLYHCHQHMSASIVRPCMSNRGSLPSKGKTPHQEKVHLEPSSGQQTSLKAKPSPGKQPQYSPSVSPKKKRTARNPAVPLAWSLLITQPCRVETTPQTTPIKGNQILGPTFFKIKFHATSKEM